MIVQTSQQIDAVKVAEGDTVIGRLGAIARSPSGAGLLSRMSQSSSV